MSRAEELKKSQTSASKVRNGDDVVSEWVETQLARVSDPAQLVVGMKREAYQKSMADLFALVTTQLLGRPIEQKVIIARNKGVSYKRHSIRLKEEEPVRGKDPMTPVFYEQGEMLLTLAHALDARIEETKSEEKKKDSEAIALFERENKRRAAENKRLAQIRREMSRYIPDPNAGNDRPLYSINGGSKSKSKTRRTRRTRSTRQSNKRGRSRRH